MDSKKYNNIKLAIGIFKGVVSFILIFLFLVTGLSEQLYSEIYKITTNAYIILLLYIIIFGSVLSIIFFPLSYYSDFHLEHKYNLSNQTFFMWIWEGLKGIFIATVIGVPLILAFYYILLKYNQLWWLPFAILLFIVSVILARVVPIIILPLFYKVTPIENEELKNRIINLSTNVNMKVENVFQFNMSKNTKKANAAFTGLGKTKRILLGDTLIKDFSEDEIETVIAHELGHYKHKHITKNLIIGTITSFLTLFLLAKFYYLSLPLFGFSEITQIAALPLLSLWGTLIGIIETPITNYISRKYEYQADEYAVRSTNKKDIFIRTLEKLTEQNLSDKNPHPLVEWFFYSHPSIKKRTQFINSLIND